MFTARGCDFCSLDDVRSPRRGEHDVLTHCSGTGGGRTEMCPPLSHVSPDRQEDGKSDFFFLERTSHLPRAVESCTVHDTHDVSLLVLSCARTGSEGRGGVLALGPCPCTSEEGSACCSARVSARRGGLAFAVSSVLIHCVVLRLCAFLFPAGLRTCDLWLFCRVHVSTDLRLQALCVGVPGTGACVGFFTLLLCWSCGVQVSVRSHE